MHEFLHLPMQLNTPVDCVQAAGGQKLALIEIPQPAAGTQPATVDELAALKLRKVLAQNEVERAELWRQVCTSECIRGQAAAVLH